MCECLCVCVRARAKNSLYGQNAALYSYLNDYFLLMRHTRYGEETTETYNAEVGSPSA